MKQTQLGLDHPRGPDMSPARTATVSLLPTSTAQIASSDPAAAVRAYLTTLTSAMWYRPVQLLCQSFLCSQGRL